MRATIHCVFLTTGMNETFSLEFHLEIKAQVDTHYQLRFDILINTSIHNNSKLLLDYLLNLSLTNYGAI